MDNLEIHFFPSNIPMPQEIIPEIIALDYQLLQQEHKWMSEYTDGETRAFTTDKPMTVAEFEQNRKENNWYIVVAVQRHPKGIELAGFEILHPRPYVEPYYGVHIKDNAFSVATLITVPHFRGKGVGTALLDYAVHVAKEMRVKNLMIDNTAKNIQANRLYNKMGFLPWAWYFIGKPVRESVSSHLLTPIHYKNITKKMWDELLALYRKQLITDAKYFYPLNTTIQDTLYETTKLNDDLKFDVFIFPNEHGWCSFGTIENTRLNGYFPICITNKGLQHPAQIRKYLYFLREEGIRRKMSGICTMYAVQPRQRDLFLSAGLTEARISRNKSVY